MGYNDHSWEESFHYQQRKESRKERKLARTKDRSQFKKTDQDQKKKHAAPVKEIPEGAKRGRVLSISSEGIVVDCQAELYLCSLRGTLKQENVRKKNLVAVGDFVYFLPEDTSHGERLGSIAVVEDRYSLLSRADNLSRQKEQLIAVNIDQVLITTSVVMPPLKTALIDRYIIAARRGNMEPVLVINKIELFESPPSNSNEEFLENEKHLFDEVVATYRNLSIRVICVSTITGEGLEELQAVMKGKASVFSGQSGVGKSSLINAVTGANLRTGDLMIKTSKGTHTTTSAQLLPLGEDGFCIDTPGIRSFGIWDLDKEEIEAYFTEIFAMGSGCRYPDCTHLHEPECAVREAVEAGTISPLRFDSYCALMASAQQEHYNR